MEFFKSLSELLGEGCTLNLTVAQKDGKMTVSVLPGNSQVKDTAKNSIVPLNVTGTPDELDAEFISTIAQPVKTSTGLLSNMAEYERATEEAAAKSKMETERKAAEEKQRKDFAAWMALAETNNKEKKFKDALYCVGEAEKIAKDDAAKLQVNKLRVKIQEDSGVGAIFGMAEDMSDGKNIKINVKPAKAATKAKSDESDECDDDE